MVAKTVRSAARSVASILDLTGTWGVYLRVSDDDQEIDTQRKTAVEFFERHEISIPPSERWYVDVNWCRDETDRRPDWLRMLADTDAGKVRNLLVTAKDRFGTASGPDKVVYYQRLRVAGCRLVLATNDAVLNGADITSNLTALIDGEAERTELNEKSNRAIDKMRHHAKAGRWMGGTIPPGLDVVCIDDTGTREFWRVQIIGDDLRVKINPDGLRQEYAGKSNFPGRDRGQFLTLRPSLDPGRLRAVQDAFAWVDAEAISNYQVAGRLNDRGDVHCSGQPWCDHHVETMLGNMAYLGQPTWNRTAQGKWSIWKGGHRVEYEEKNTHHHKQDRADWVIPNQQFEPIIDPEQFERVQTNRKARKRGPRAPKHPDMWLSGLLYCRHCGEKLHGQTANGKPRYICASYIKARSQGKKIAPKCPFYYIDHSRAEEIVGQFLDDTGQHLPKPTGRKVEGSAAIQTAWESVVTRLAEADAAVRQRVMEWARSASPQELAPYIRQRDGVVLEGEKPVHDASGEPVTRSVDYLDAAAAYRQLFAAEARQSQARLDQVEAEERELSLALALPGRLPTANSRKHVQTRLADLAIEVAHLQAKITNAADHLEEARRQWSQLLTDWDAAMAALAAEITGREKANAMRRVIARIDLTFQETGRVKPKYYAAVASIVPVDAGGESHEYVSNAVSAGRTITRGSAGTRGCGCGTRRSRSINAGAIGGFN